MQYLGVVIYRHLHANAIKKGKARAKEKKI